MLEIKPNLFKAKKLATGEMINFIGIKGDPGPKGDKGDPGKDATPYDDTEIRQEVSDVKEDLQNKVGFEDYATHLKTGVIKALPYYSLGMDNGALKSLELDISTYQSKASASFISKGTLENRLAPTEEELSDVKADLQKLPSDVQINGTTIVDSNNVANIPIATAGTQGQLGLTKIGSGLTVNANGLVDVSSAGPSATATRSAGYTLTANNLDLYVKSAMCDGKGAEWTDEEKANARTRMGASGNIIQYVDVNVPSKMYVSVASAAGKPINGVLNVLGLGTEEIAQASIVDARPVSFTLCITVSTPMNVRIYYY